MIYIDGHQGLDTTLPISGLVELGHGQVSLWVVCAAQVLK